MAATNQIIIYGASDDCIEIDGAVRDEFNVYDEPVTLELKSPSGEIMKVTLEYGPDRWKITLPQISENYGDWSFTFGDHPDAGDGSAVFIDAPAGTTVRLEESDSTVKTSSAPKRTPEWIYESLKKTVEGIEKPAETTVVVTAIELLQLIQRVETAEQKVVWLERKKRTIADLATAARNWGAAKIELADKRILHIEEVLEAGQGVFNGLTDDTDFKRGYRAGLYWFRSEILDDELFAEQKKAADARKN